MPRRYEKTWKRSAFKERNDKICRLWTEGITVSILSERFGLSDASVRYILKGAGLYGKKPRLGSDPLEGIRDTQKGKIIIKETEGEGRRDKS